MDRGKMEEGFIPPAGNPTHTGRIFSLEETLITERSYTGRLIYPGRVSLEGNANGGLSLMIAVGQTR